MRAPIFVDDHGDISAFATVKDAELWLEEIDIENDEYNIYAADGQELIASVNSANPKSAVAPIIELKASGSGNKEKLRAGLVSFLERAGLCSKRDLRDESLEGVRYFFVENVGYTK